eukprot:1185180-Prorocentrum_minimum.AAC.3
MCRSHARPSLPRATERRAPPPHATRSDQRVVTGHITASGSVSAMAKKKYKIAGGSVDPVVFPAASAVGGSGCVR